MLKLQLDSSCCLLVGSGAMGKKMETTIMGYIGLYRGCIGIMEKKMETTI